jgi:hypothetical protein
VPSGQVWIDVMEGVRNARSVSNVIFELLGGAAQAGDAEDSRQSDNIHTQSRCACGPVVRESWLHVVGGSGFVRAKASIIHACRRGNVSRRAALRVQLRRAEGRGRPREDGRLGIGVSSAP